MGTRVTRRMITAHVIDLITRWGEATKNELRQYCHGGQSELLDSTLAQLLADRMLVTAEVPPSTSAKNQHAMVTVYRLRPVASAAGWVEVATQPPTIDRARRGRRRTC